MSGKVDLSSSPAALGEDPRLRRNALLLLHLTVFIWGWTGILGKWIDQGALQIVYIRCAIACIGLFVVALWMRRPLSPRTPDLGRYLLTGLIILAHWVTFYLAIKRGSASVAVACLSTSTFFTALITPYWTKRRISGFELALGVVIVAALLLIFGLETEYREGIILGTISALLSAWFNVVNGRLVQRGDAMSIGFYEMFAAMVVLGLWLAWRGELPEPIWRMPAHDLIGHLILGIVCTTFAFTAGIHVLKQLSPFTVILTVNLEPVYTILIALMIWPESERMHPGSYIGIALILACISLNGWRQRRMNVKMVKPRPLAQG
ncbi:MAG: DMT family transporter [Flavobacteriales bacterium]|jgi:drug/metabolite transporter (DMT)-like permease|nr:DMT family transporter [Flavobacteriales bacterium]MBK7249173.1 DMT family transporter [Flavobacteriales bacterium]MBK9058592.1 DMT family transporter [Flavobacteriales bacterium]MBK9599801.1 DMT family transporter [Flavobacteriales bacterium]QQS71399.1 MAG: DMT family transporter [Flavobacteriales bacterium]